MRRLLKSISLTSSWIDLKISPSELRASFTLVTGQSFGWERVKEHEIWIGVIKSYPLAIKQTSDSILYTCLNESNNLNEIDEIVRSYFQLDVCLTELYELVGIH